MKIIFTDTIGINEIYSVKPSRNVVPEWYKKMPTYTDGNEKKPNGVGSTNGTVKKCMPVFDAVTAGYIISSYSDVFVTIKTDHEGNKSPYYEWPSLNPVTFHPIEQASLHPKQNGAAFPKWTNPYGIKTPKGYSCLFLPPMHRESIFTIFEGVVDTDNYSAPVHFPFVLKDTNFEGLIPAGTPIAQVIPFKRDEWEIEFGAEKEQEDIAKTVKLLKSRFFDSYKTFFRQIKEYK